MAEKVDKKIIEKLMNGKNVEFSPKYHKIQRTINDGIIEIEKHFGEGESNLKNLINETRRLNRKGEILLIFLIICSIGFILTAYILDKSIFDLSANDYFKDKRSLILAPLFTIVGFFSILSYIASLTHKKFTFKIYELIPNLVTISLNMNSDFMNLPIDKIAIEKKGKDFNSDYKKRLRKNAYIMLKYNKLVELYDNLLKNQNSPE